MFKLHNGDVFNFLSAFDDNHFDVVITSPPYNMNLRVNQRGDGYCSRQITKELSTKYNGFNDNLPMEDYRDFLVRLIKELVRASGLVFFNIQMITGNKPALFSALGEVSHLIKEVVVWDKGNGQPAIQEGVMNSCYEFIYIFSDSAITRSFPDAFGRGELDNIWRIPKERSTLSTHQATFPQSLSDFVIYNFGLSGKKILDPMMGTGTVGVSCAKFDCEFYGCEIVEDYYRHAVERVGDAYSQGDMFNV